MRRADVIVVGGGLIGAATAWWLASAGRDVVLLEQFEAGHERGSSHGGVRIFRFAYPEADYVALAREALELWRQLEAESGETLLELTGGIDFGWEIGVRAVADCLAAQGARFDLLSVEAARERFAGFAFDGPVLFQPEGGRCHAARSVAALARLAAERGAEVRYEEPVQSIGVDGSAGVVRTAVEEYRAPAVVVAAGGWVTGLLAGIPGLTLPPLRVTQEQPAHFAPRDAGVVWPSFIEHAPNAAFSTYGLLEPGVGVKFGEHQVGPVVDAATRSLAIDPGAVERLRGHARRVLPGVDPDPVAVDTCLYTTTANDDFVIDRVGPITVASACSGHGFKFGPATGRLVAEVALGRIDSPPRFRLPAR